MHNFPRQDDLDFESGRQSWSGFISGDLPLIPVAVRKRLSRRSLTPTQNPHQSLIASS